MQFDFTPEQKVTPRAAGLLGVGVPEEYGGAGMGTMGLCLAVEQVAQYCCASGLSVAKLTATDCLQEYPMERRYRDAKQLQIVEGTSQVQKHIIGRSLLEGDLYW